MNKAEFLSQLGERLKGLPQDELQERLSFYAEMIEDRMEEGLSETEAVEAIGSAEAVAEQIIAQMPLAKLAKQTIKPKRDLTAWEITFLAVGSPIWFSLLVAALSVVFSVYVSLWAGMIALWSGFAALVGGAFGGLFFGSYLAVAGNLMPGLAAIGAALVCAGISIFFFFGCKAATDGLIWLTKKMGIWIKNRLMKKGAAV